MMQYSTIPPCKVYFNIDIPTIKGESIKKKRKSKRESKATKLTYEAFKRLSGAYKEIKEFSF